jgi:hypothetical protein
MTTTGVAGGFCHVACATPLKKGSRQMLHRRLVSLPALCGRLPVSSAGSLMGAQASASTAVSAVVALPHGLLDPLIVGVLVVPSERGPRMAAGLGGAIAPRNQVEPVKPLLMTWITSSSDTPRRLSIS